MYKMKLMYSIIKAGTGNKKIKIYTGNTNDLPVLHLYKFLYA
jgi:hypothetical protein